MADNTAIEWTDATWQITTGCSVVSPGCTNCYAQRLAGTRLQHHPSRQGLTTDSKAGPVWNGKVRFNEEWLEQPLRWKRPRRVFVSAHGDLFHENIADEWIDRVFAVMALAPQHTFQVLTKRAARMRDYMTVPGLYERIYAAACELTKRRENLAYGPQERNWPPRWVWLGVSVEDQQRADERIPLLLDTPAAKRFISAEPLLGHIDLRNLRANTYDAITGCGDRERLTDWGSEPSTRLDWVIAGGESGKGARPCDPAWIRMLRDQCASAEVAFFFKQWGQHFPAELIRTGPDGEVWRTQHDGEERWSIEEFSVALAEGAVPVQYDNVGKKAAGRLLDGRTWDEFPA